MIKYQCDRCNELLDTGETKMFYTYGAKGKIEFHLCNLCKYSLEAWLNENRKINKIELK
jgi:hypothetical protein